MDRLRWMETFVKVAELGHFSGAARGLGVSRAAVSKYVEALEERLGAQLIHRTTRRLSLTREGEAYLQRCRRILEEIADAEASVGEMRASPRGILRINGPMSFGHLHLAPAIADFLTRHPDIQVECELNDHYVGVVEEGWDVVVRIGTLEDSSLIAHRLAPARLVLCASPDYFAQHGTPERPEALSAHRCLGYSHAAAGNAWRFHGPEGQTARVPFSSRLRVNNGDAIRKALLLGLGMAVMPTFIVGEDLQTGALRTAMTDWRCEESSIWAVCPPSRRLSAKVRAFIDFLHRRFGPRPYWDLVA
ncbi:MAG: LysR family transcriptional regulator [Magnetococcales bacterium]|nr:LysR family transcriptional regulator [Magnetococcales bacterium]